MEPVVEIKSRTESEGFKIIPGESYGVPRLGEVVQSCYPCLYMNI